MQETWAERVVDRLAALRLTGCSFETAWFVAVAENPPRGRDLGPETPTLFGGEESLVEFTRRVCADAWVGACPHLRYLETALQDLAVEPHDGPARRRRHLAKRAVAA